MAMQRVLTDFPRLSSDVLDKWRSVPSSVASDSQNRCQSMDARIKPMVPGMRICGQARTVVPMPADNSMVHHAVSCADPGDVIVVAGGGLEDVAMAGEWVVRCCKRRNLGGLVVDGTVRDLHEIRSLGVPVFAKGAVPRGPHKNFGGKMDVTASVGNVPVNPGDIILGDEDGIVVVPLALAEETLARSLALLERERQWTAEIEAGRTLVEVLGVPPLEIIERDRA
ncbi:RraA family protein [Azospirillum thermophilum]|uniref:Putative 4-hydroxy-4-methyl-2-oxoglutarate aldolase n=1 Tax=Azospirillum thermophilum TaxID=2202148 RepID=A0A2S2CT36_9PROT|nr:dimethylmenaquinone methyltransferase [Azospirillum thermophilum]AWK87683.1 dimethylmenaquinone methyltransferase [Azospirillum thermophilum]